jgi:hypothetical protein
LQAASFFAKVSYKIAETIDVCPVKKCSVVTNKDTQFSCQYTGFDIIETCKDFKAHFLAYLLHPGSYLGSTCVLAVSGISSSLLFSPAFFVEGVQHVVWHVQHFPVDVFLLRSL